MASGQLQEGTLLNERYRIVRVIGQGGMGTVYLAEHVRLDTIVAVKEVRGQPDHDEEFRLALGQCEREARFLVRLHHPNLPTVTDAFVENERFYLVMEYVEGVTLETRLKEAGPHGLDVAQVVDWGLQIADVLAYLHSQDPPIIFRDLKPSNVMIQSDGGVRLIDFGIARRFQPGANKDTALLGSVGYSPPEQFGKHQTDTRSDIYAFAATLHHLLTGRDPAAQPFKFPPAHTLNQAVPESLSRLLTNCLAMDVDARPAGIHEVALSLLAVRDELAAAPPAAVLSPAARVGLPAEGAATLPAHSATSGPRIISTKLAEAEAQKRRSSSKETHRVPPGTTPVSRPAASAGANAGLRNLLIAVCLLVIVGGGILAVALSRPHSHKASHPHTSVPIIQPIVPPVPPATTAPTDPSQAGGSQPAPTDRSATLDNVDAKAILPGQGGYQLQIVASGQIRGQANKAGMVAAFFYDGNNNPILAHDQAPPYANTDGQLSVAHSLPITTDPQPFEVALEVPLSQFPQESLAGAVKFRCALFIDGKRMDETDMRLLPFSLLTAPPQPTGGDTGAGTPSNPPNGQTPGGMNGSHSNFGINGNDSGR